MMMVVVIILVLVRGQAVRWRWLEVSRKAKWRRRLEGLTPRTSAAIGITAAVAAGSARATVSIGITTIATWGWTILQRSRFRGGDGGGRGVDCGLGRLAHLDERRRTRRGIRRARGRV